MDKQHENRNSMHKAVDTFFIERPAKIESSKALNEKVASSHNLCIDIDSKLEQLLNSTNLFSTEKCRTWVNSRPIQCRRTRRVLRTTPAQRVADRRPQRKPQFGERLARRQLLFEMMWARTDVPHPAKNCLRQSLENIRISLSFRIDRAAGCEAHGTLCRDGLYAFGCFKGVIKEV